jgi:anionic glutamate receptor
VTMNMYIRSFYFDDLKQRVSADITYRQEWTDERLAYGNMRSERSSSPPFVVLPTDSKIWMPDTFIQNELESHRHELFYPNRLIRIHTDGRVLHSERISVVLRCQTVFEYFPFDKQLCLLDSASYAYTADDITYVWKDKDAVQLKVGLFKSNQEFDITNTATTDCTSRTNTGDYSCTRVIITLQRCTSAYVFPFFLPSAVFVIFSWLTFWIGKESTMPRLMLGSVSFLGLVYVSNVVKGRIPWTRYLKPSDIWIGTCFAFSLFAVIESVLVHYYFQRRMRKLQEKGYKPVESEIAIASKQCRRVDSIDGICRLAFPLLFAIFAVAYTMRCWA